MRTLKTATVGTVAALLLIPALASAGRVTIRRDEVVPIVFQNELTISDSREGDRFEARLDRSSALDLPIGTRFIGRVVRVREASDKRAASMDLEFTDIELPNGDRTPISAVPVSMDNKRITRNPDGRFTINKDDRRKENSVLGGAVGGLIIGSILGKPAEGLIIGTLGGIVVAETGKDRDPNLVVKKGQHMGAYFDKEIQIEFNARDQRQPNSDRTAHRNQDASKPTDRPYRIGENGETASPPVERFELQYDEKTIQFEKDVLPYRDGKTVMVPLEQVAKQLDLQVDKVDSRWIFVEDDNTSLKLERDSKEYRLNGKKSVLDKAVVVKDGIIYVPVEVLASTKSKAFTVNGNVVKI